MQAWPASGGKCNSFLSAKLLPSLFMVAHFFPRQTFYHFSNFSTTTTFMKVVISKDSSTCLEAGVWSRKSGLVQQNAVIPKAGPGLSSGKKLGLEGAVKVICPGSNL
jgi:hypothetical protein